MILACILAACDLDALDAGRLLKALAIGYFILGSARVFPVDCRFHALDCRNTVDLCASRAGSYLGCANRVYCVKEHCVHPAMTMRRSV